MRRTSAGRRRSRGQSLVEFALVLPIFLLVVVAIFDVGRAVFAYNTLTDAARAGARTAIVNQGSGVAKQVAIDRAIGLGLAPVNVTVLYLADGLANPCTPPNIGCVAEVTVTYTYKPVTPLVNAFLPQFDMTTTTEMSVERVYP